MSKIGARVRLSHDRPDKPPCTTGETHAPPMIVYLLAAFASPALATDLAETWADAPALQSLRGTSVSPAVEPW